MTPVSLDKMPAGSTQTTSPTFPDPQGDEELPAPFSKEADATAKPTRAWLRSKAFKATVVVALLVGISSPFFLKRGKKIQTWSNDQAPPVTAFVTSAPFQQEVVERGEIESSSNVDARCEVQGRGSLGTAIIQIVAEGTYVNKDDFLVKLDDSTLKADLVQQQIACNTSRASVVETQAEVASARLALKEYESGTFLQEEQALESEEFVAKENLRRAEEYVRYSERLASRGYVTEVQLEADRFSVEKCRKELASARTKLDVLHRLTKQKTLNKLNADLEIAEARLKSRENSHALDNDKLTQIQTQIQKCIINAPTSGQVVYANDPRNTTGEPLIAEGKLVRERQVIIRLPDPKRMQVTARINESRVDKVKIGMHVRIKVDAFPGTEMQGTVREVSEYPLPSQIAYSTFKEYATEIEIHDPHEGLRAGMTAQVAIEVQNLEKAVQVALPAVMERDKRFFCMVLLEGSRIEAREVILGLANDKTVVVESGLDAGQSVVLAPQNYEDLVTLPAAIGKPKPKSPPDPRPLSARQPKKKQAMIPTALPALAKP
ncbi:MAG: efflux RND transporter periplasmic adaptor subunit [Chthoniobacteraceae bacterium]